MRLGCRFVLLMIELGLVPGVFAQISTATISGRVTDSTGAVVAGAQMTVTSAETQFKSAAQTNSEGLYRIQSLLPGTYQVSCESPGFKKAVESGISLHVGDVLPVDLVLQVGATTESVEVNAQATLLESETSTVGTLTEGDTLYKLNLYQRYITNTLSIVPGVTNSTQGGTNGLSAFYVAGQRNTGTATFEDGVFANDPVTSNLLVIKPIMNSVDEVKVLTGTLPAEYGHSSGGVITTVKKSGTNEFHGAVSDYGRDRFMTHRQFFNLYTTSQPQFGNPNGVEAFFMMPDGNGGGPVIIPKVYNGKNRTFWYSGYNKLIEKKTQSYTGVTPTPAELAGDFSFGGAGQQIYYPNSTVQNADGTWVQRTPIPGNVIPKSMFDPVAVKILSYNIWRAPNTPGSFSSTGPVSNFTYDPPSRTFFEDFSERVDHQVNSKLRLYGSWTYNHENGLERPTNIQVQVFDGFSGNNAPATQQNSSAGATYIISPTAVDELRVSFFRPRNDFFVPSENQNWAAILGIPNVSPALMPSFSPANGLGINPVSTAPDYPQLYGLGSAQGATRQIRQSESLRDDFSKISGKHAFKMGYEILLFTDNYYQQGLPSGQFNFTNTTANLQPNGQPVPNTGNTFAAFELGAVSSAQFTTYTNTWQPRENINSLYFQDDWKFSDKLTLNVGLRWSTESPYHTAHGQESNFSPTTIDPLTGLLGAVLHPTGGLNSRDWKNFQPRLGFAYHPREKLVVRGGVALYTIDIRWPNTAMQFDEYLAVNNEQRAANDPRVLFQLSQGPAPVTYNIQPNGTASYVGTNYSARNITWLDPTLHPGYSMNWNFGAEYQISSNNLIKVFYAGSVGVHLVESWNINGIPTSFGAGNPTLQNAVFANSQAYLPYPQFGTINHMANTGHSSYHSGTVQYTKRYSNSLVVDSFYTYSKALDDCDNDYGTCTGVAPLTDRNLNKGRAGFDMRHRFVTSFTYELPVGKGRHFRNRGGFLDYIIGGYDLSWIQTVDTGNPFGFTFANSPYNYYPTSSGIRVPNLVATPTMPQFGAGQNIGPNRFNQSGEYVVVGASGGNPATYANCALPTCDISAFAPPPAFTPGNAGRNILTGPAAYFSQISVKKNFRITERITLQFRWDFQNPFHNYAFAAPSSAVDFKNPQLFGKITGETATASIQGEPLMNIMLRLSW